jgi:putative hydroxymethylpyrimidine transport system substrate-binding protein
MKRLLAAMAIATAVAVAGCGELPNTYTPQPGTANNLTVVLPGAPNASDVGIYYAAALGYLRQTDLNVRLEIPPSGSGGSLQLLEKGQAQVAISSEPDVLLGRNDFHPLVSVGAILQAPTAPTVTCSTRKRTAKHPHPASSCKTTAGTVPSAYAAAPTYNGLVFVVTEHSIVGNAPLPRRLVQAVARGYAAARANPQAATQALLTAVPNLPAKATLAAVKATLPLFFPTGNHPWGWQSASDWNAMGNWMTRQHLITNMNATPDASTNELLAGQGV